MVQTIGAKIRDARVARGMTQEELASAVSVSRSTLSSWERGRTQPDLESLARLSELLQCDLLDAPVAEEAAGDDAPAEPASVQPQPSPENSSALSPARRKWWILVLAALLICAGVTATLLLRPAPSAFPEKTFRQETPNVAGQAFVEFENTKQEQVIGENAYSIYDFKLCERNGVGFDIVSAEITMEGKSGALRVMTEASEDLQAAGFSTRVEPGGTTSINGGWPKGEFKRVGIAVHIQDDSGAAQTYYSMMEF